MQPSNEDEAWRAIVDNYGERPDLDVAPPPDEIPADPPDLPIAVAPAVGEPEERFVPPPPPPLPVLPLDRMLAWLGVFGSPTVLLLSLFTGVQLPPWVGYLLVTGFVGGFLYLVARMQREPRDPGDDGARL